MPPYHLLKASFQPGHIQVTLDPPCHKHVVESISGLEPVQKPKLLLRIGKRKQRRPYAGTISRRKGLLLLMSDSGCSLRNAKAFLLQQAMQEFPLFFQEVFFQRGSSGRHLLKQPFWKIPRDSNFR